MILSVHTLHWAGSFLVPVTAALLGFLIALPLERKLTSWGIPSIVTAAGVTLILGMSIAMVLLTLSGPLMDLIDDLPDLMRELRRSSTEMGGDTLAKLQDASKAASDAIAGEGDAVKIEIDQKSGILTQILTRTPALGGQLALTLILLFFMIASGATFLRKLVMVVPNFKDKRTAVDIVNSLAQKLGLYLSGITLINAGLGICIGLSLWALGLPNPALFGFIGFSFNFVPYLGAMAGATLAGLVGFNSSNDLWFAGIVFATYMTLTSVEGNVVTPYIVAGRLRLNTTIVFITVAFFAWIWSVIGMVVAVPILISAKIILDEIPATRGFGLFLGDTEDRYDTTS